VPFGVLGGFSRDPLDEFIIAGFITRAIPRSRFMIPSRLQVMGPGDRRNSTQDRSAIDTTGKGRSSHFCETTIVAVNIHGAA
jgi:hypothetical protein